MMSAILIHSFEPIVSDSARVLILGSMPGVRSLTQQQYYAHPQNAFWRIISTLLGTDLHATYAQRVAYLRTSGIGVWDVLHACERTGSLDSSIAVKSEVANDFVALFQTYPNIRHVFFNGAKAEASFKRHVSAQVKDFQIAYQRLPSTSPAHAGMSFESKLNDWRIVLDFLK
jgi:TDG/mug DNA glycosylase family protein